MPSYRILPPTPALVEALAARLGAKDRDEIAATGYDTALEGLMVSVEASRDALTLLADGEPVAMAGVSDWGAISTTGVPWALTSDNIREHALPFLKSAKILADHWLKEYNRLCQVVDERNVDAMRWMEWVGFEKRGRHFLGPDRMPFAMYEMRA
jgi:hypothetical protein